MIILRFLFILFFIAIGALHAAESSVLTPAPHSSVMIQHNSAMPGNVAMFQVSEQPLKIAVLSSSKVIGRYSRSMYNVSMATLLGLKRENFDLRQFDIPDESSESIDQALREIRGEGFSAILAPLTADGAKNLVSLETRLPIFVPTVHRRDLPSAADNIVFGAIDYESQIEALLPYMSDSIAIFYDKSPVGENLKTKTEAIFMATNAQKKSVASYPVDIRGDKIVSHLSKPSAFNKKSIIMHIPVVKSSILAAHLTFTKVKEKNILSTQINVDPTLLTLTQYNDRKNMILANSLVDFPDAIYQSNEMMGNDLSFDWVNYAGSVGIDYLVSVLEHSPRSYSMRIINSQVVYPIELLRAKEFGFEPI